MIIHNFLEFIYESKYDSFSETVATTIMQIISDSTSEKGAKRRIIKTLGYAGLLDFELHLLIIRSRVFEPEKRKKFKEVPWEKYNFENYGFAIDSNSYIQTAPSVDSDIEINLIINPDREPNLYHDLELKLIDSIRHEVEHLLQKGQNEKSSHSGNLSKNREQYTSSYKYFLLSDEMPAMVSGMRLSSIKRGCPIDVEFADYLEPIVKYGLITNAEAQKVIREWIKYTIKHFPETKISKKSLN